MTKGHPGVSGHCLTGITAKRIGNQKFPYENAASFLTPLKSLSLDLPFGNKNLHASGMCLGVPYMLHIQPYDSSALDGRKEVKDMSFPLCAMLVIFLWVFHLGCSAQSCWRWLTVWDTDWKGPWGAGWAVEMETPGILCNMWLIPSTCKNQNLIRII